MCFDWFQGPETTLSELVGNFGDLLGRPFIISSAYLKSVTWYVRHWVFQICCNL